MRKRFLILPLGVLLMGLALTVFAGASSSSAATNTCGSQLGGPAAFCDHFDAPAGTGNRSGDLNGNVWGVSRISQGDNTSQGMLNSWAPTTLDLCGTNVTNVLPPNDVRICNGQLRESLNDGGSQATLAMYPKQPFDFAGRTGTISFDLTSDEQGGHAAWPEIWLTDKPVPAPSNTNGGELSSYPQNGVEISFDGGASPNNWGQCSNNGPTYRTSVGEIAVVRNFQLTNLALTQVGCVQDASGPDGALNHFEIQISQGQIDVYGTDPGSSTLVHLATAANADLPITRGLVWMTDTHYNACKFNNQCVHTFVWDNFAFDGPVLPRDLTFDALDAMQPIGNQPNLCPCGASIYNLGWESTASNPATVSTLPMTAQNIAAASAALVLTNIHVEQPGTVVNYAVNGHAHSIPWPPQGEVAKLSLALPIALGDLVPGANVVGIWADQTAVINNVDILLVGAGGVPGGPTPTPQPSATPTGTSTATATATLTSTPTPTPTTAATATPSPTTTPSPTPTAKPTVTATPTPVPVCREAYFLNGVLTQGAVITCP